MPIILRLDRVMADRKMSLNELSEKVGVANVNLSKLKNGIKAVSQTAKIGSLFTRQHFVSPRQSVSLSQKRRSARALWLISFFFSGG